MCWVSPWVAMFAAAGVGWFLSARGNKVGGTGSIWWAWAASVVVTILAGNYAADRYLFFLLPPLLAIAMLVLHRAAEWAARPAWAWLPPVALAAVYFAFHLGAAPRALNGPAEAARLVAADGVTRVIYCGDNDGQFVFALRSQAPAGEPVVIRGEKLAPATFGPARFEAFANEYGISHVVLERRDGGRIWDPLLVKASASMRLLRRVELSGVTRGALEVYRFTNPSPEPRNRLVVRSWKSDYRGTSMTLDFSPLRKPAGTD